jgi:nucleotidyltransferase/DNA polymerase involved in DNA repair
MEAALAKLAGEVATRLDKHQRYGYTLTLKVKYADYQQMTRAQTVTGYYGMPRRYTAWQRTCCGHTLIPAAKLDCWLNGV